MKRGYEPRRGSVMVKTIDTTTADRLRRSSLYLDLSPSCARKRACMELTIISRFQRLQATQSLLHSPFVIVFQRFRLDGALYSILIVNGNLLTHLKHAEGMSLRYGVYVMVLLNLLIFFVNGAHYYII